MTAVAKGVVTIKVRHSLLKTKQLPGTWGVLYDARDNKPPRIELYEEKGARTPLHTLYLEHVKFSDKGFKQPEPTFSLSIKKEKHLLEFDAMDSKDEWVQALCHVSSDLWKQRASSVDLSETEESEEVPEMSENLLYDSCDKVQQFKASIVTTRASDSNNLQGHYMLNPARDCLRLLDVVSFKCIHEWPYRQIRKYGRTKNIFRMEVGRRCTTGEGDFEFYTPEGPTLTDLITVYTKQLRMHEGEQDGPAAKTGHHTSISSLQSDGDYIPPPSTPSPRCSPGPPIPRRVSERNSRGDVEADTVKRDQRGGSMSLSKNPEAPRPAPRANTAGTAPKQENGFAKPPGPKKSSSSSDRKIYETPSGLTAPLEGNFKNELHSKLQVQLPSPDDLNNADMRRRLSSGVIEDDEPSSPDPAEASGRNRSSSNEGFSFSLKKKKSDKEQKKKEKEEAKLKKQREKEAKEQREREAKEQKEREKKAKKEAKSHSKLMGKKSLDQAYPTPQHGNEGNIYDEPGELMAAAGASGRPALSEGAYAEAEVQPTAPPAEYATPEKPKKDSWKKHARPESQDVQQENYDSIKQAALQPSAPALPPPLPPQASLFREPPSDYELEDDDTYNRLGDFDKRKPVEQEESVYGMASGKPTIAPARPVVQSSEEGDYEDTATVSVASEQRSSKREAGDGYEEASTPVQQQARNIIVPDDGDYAAVS